MSEDSCDAPHGARQPSGSVTEAATDWMFEGGGEMGVLVRATDWSKTPLGPIAAWPQSLRVTVAAMLHSRHPMFLWWGPELIQIYNDAYAPSLGVGKHPSAMGQRGRQCWPEIWPIIGPQIDDVMQRGKASWHEDALVPIFRDGAMQEVYWTYGYSPVFDEAGAVAGTLVVCTETTARVIAARREKEMLAQAEEERAHLRRFFDQVPAGVCILRGDSMVFDFANDGLRRLVGRGRLLGVPLLSAIPELEGQGLIEPLQRVIRNGEPFAGNDVLVKVDRDGTGVARDYFYTLICSPFREGNDSVDAVIVLAFDVTGQVVARRQTEELTRQLRESEEHFHTVAESIPQLAWEARADGQVDWYNRRWYEYTGKTFDQMAGWGWKIVHDPGLVDDVSDRWTASLAAGEPFEMQFPLRRHDGVFRWHLSRAVPLRDAEGRVVRWFGTNTDVDETRKAELERIALLESEKEARRTAEVASRAKDDFLATASHELRTPLNSILGWVQMLRTGHLDPGGYLRAIEVIERNARSQVRLIEDILDGSRIVTGNLQLEIRSLDMTKLVRAAVEAVRPAAQAKKIELAVVVDPAAARVVGDAERLQQIVWNLVSNAIKFTPKGGRVDVSLKREGTDIELRVKDTGQGIRADFLPHVFERFRQAEGSTTRRHGGLGLGLALVHYLVEAHGGTVRAHSEGEGQGAEFVVRLPVQAVFAEPAEERVSQPPPSPAMSLVGVTALVVDDEADARDLVATVLRAKGAEVTTAAGAVRALELLSESRFTILVSDIGMPETDGYELMRRVRTTMGAHGAQMPAIALTAYAREEDRRLALAAGFQAHVVKPTEPENLVRQVARLVEGLEPPCAADAPGAEQTRAGAFSKFERILSTQGLREALRFLNGRTAHRFTGIYRFDPPMLRSVQLLDSENPEVEKGEDAPIEETYCAILASSGRTFTTEDSHRDARLRAHPARDSVVSYCGVLLKGEDGKPVGTLCHFDVVPCDVPVLEMQLMEAVAPLLAKTVTSN